MAASRTGRLRMIVAALAIAAPAGGCTTTDVNFVVTDGKATDLGTDWPDAAAVSTGDPDGAAGDLGGVFDAKATDAPMDAVASDDPAPLLTDIDAQKEEAGLTPSFVSDPSASGPARYVRYKCCVSATGACFIANQGDDTTCRDAATWNSYATTDCENQGLIVNGVGIYVGC